MRHAIAVPLRPVPAALALALALLTLPLAAARYRVVDENGKAVPGARVSVLGRAGSVAADPKGEELGVVVDLEDVPGAHRRRLAA